MQLIGKIPFKGKRRRLLSVAAFFICCVGMGWLPVDAQLLPIDFSITNTMLPGGYGSVQGDVISFALTGTMPFPESIITGPYTFPGRVWITDTMPGGLNFGGFVAPPGWECKPLTLTLPPPASNETAWGLSCQSPRLTISDTQHFPILITSTVGTAETRTLTQIARISTIPAVITGTEPIDPNPSNNIAAVPFAVNTEKPPPAAVPTLGQWGTLIFIILLGVAMVHAIRKRKFN